MNHPERGRRKRSRRPTWLRLPGLRVQIALAVWGAVMLTNGMATDLATTTVMNANQQAIVRAQDGARAGQTSSWLANPDATPAEFGRVRAQSGATVQVWQVPVSNIRRDPSGLDIIELPASPAWQSAGEVMREDIYIVDPVGSGSSKHWLGAGTSETVMQAFPRGDGSLLVAVETYDPGVDWTSFRLLESSLTRQGWALGVLSGMGAWLLSGALMRPARRASEVARRLGRGELSARVPVRGNDEIAALGTSMNEMASSLQRMMDTQRHFISDTAHELRTPTAALLASASALDEPATRDEAAALVSPQLRRLSALTEDLLALSRFDDGREALDDQIVDLVSVAESAARQVAAGQDVRVHSDGPVFAIVDPARVSTIVRNLVSNGLKHGEVPVVVVVSETDDQGVIRVSDAGRGVPMELREAIFHRFVRGDDARHGEGAGLGLAIARENAELHGGTLDLAADGHGFTLRLPISPPTLAPGTDIAERPVGVVSRTGVAGIGPSDVLSGLFFNGAAMFLVQRGLGWPVAWGGTAGLVDGLPCLMGFPTTLVLAGRWLAARRGSVRPWLWGWAALLPLLLFLALPWQQVGATLATTLGCLLWMVVQKRR
ncbi:MULTISPECIES: HAMP domain-containing sensor histidine kinase [unclassified Luteococcus]|uniref:HAMP domain-containing sensor histidine kinase n=1 Tax=unclassified Luteococcus TaxID=2639923 RepID=UPI00313EFB2A